MLPIKCILSKCILDRIKPWAEDILGDYQAGFRQNRSITDQIFILKQIFQKMWEFDREVHVLFIDFKKAYDCIHRESLLNVLRQFKLPQKLINLIKANILHTEIKIKVGNIVSQGIPVSTGLRQGDAM
jgi:predicted alpha/beta-fold hydrolase